MSDGGYRDRVVSGEDLYGDMSFRKVLEYFPRVLLDYVGYNDCGQRRYSALVTLLCTYSGGPAEEKDTVALLRIPVDSIQKLFVFGNQELRCTDDKVTGIGEGDCLVFAGR